MSPIAPSWMRSIVSMYRGSWRRCKPMPTIRFFFFDSSTAVEHPPHADGIRSDRLLHEDVLALVDGIFELLRLECRAASR